MSTFRYTRPEAFPPIIKNIIIINVLVFLAQSILDKQYDITGKLILYPILSDELKNALHQVSPTETFPSFQPYQIFTHMFAHAPFPNIFHILFNMFTLWMFGRILENVWGGKRFLIFYLASGVGAAALHLFIQYLRCEDLLHAIQANDMAGIMKYKGALAGALGASGAVMGVMAAFAYTFPNTELYIMFIPIPIKAKWAVLGFVIIDLFGGISSSGDNIAHFAHLGGALTGFIIVFIWNKTNRKSLY
ncbi:MAG: rhomboid family intramembrane serine protease [Chitinophagaceae bacterium]|jgi:membrane associated rhomboid family serine protease|nr:rhomboid family intramembrane serine protease [Chitinophagaceae bacterium]OQY92523.1 MAG: rhomboid family intramembrane serine protease [Sphingobacteriales bacterium UTBCD1]